MLNLYNIAIEAVLNEDPQERSSEVSPDLVQMRLLVLWGLHPLWGPGWFQVQVFRDSEQNMKQQHR